jgi:hypothetical protein
LLLLPYKSHETLTPSLFLLSFVFGTQPSKRIEIEKQRTRAAAMGSERNGGVTDRPAAGEEQEGGAPPFETPEIRFTKLFINGRFVDAVSGTTATYPANSPSRFVYVLPSCLRNPESRMEIDRSE